MKGEAIIILWAAHLGSSLGRDQGVTLSLQCGRCQERSLFLAFGTLQSSSSVSAAWEASVSHKAVEVGVVELVKEME